MRQEALPELLKAEEVAEILRVSVWSVYRWAEDGTLPSVRVASTVRFRRDDIERILHNPEPVA